MATKKRFIQETAWVSLLAKRRDEVAKIRDKLRDDVATLLGLENCCSRAVEDLDSAIEALSELA
jgi:hypothetical protein